MDEPHTPLSTTPSPLKATAIVGLGSAVTLGLSVVVAKAFAILIGPIGLGRLGLLQSTLNIAMIVVGAGLGTTVVRRIAADRRQPTTHGHELAAVVAGAFLGLAGAAVLFALREPISASVLGSTAHETDIALIALALGLSVITGVLVAVLTGRHEIRAVTVIAVVGGLAAAALGIPLVGRYGEAGLAPMLVLTALVQFVVGVVLLRPSVALAPVVWSRIALRAGRLMGEGLPVALSQLVGQGVQLGIPIVILHILGASDVGLYRAAATVSVGYLTFFLATLSQDFYPRLAATSSSHQAGVAVERRMRLLMGLGVPLIFVLLAASPLLIHVLYSAAFEPAVGLLRWQLAGDILRLPAWVLGFVLLANGRMVRYFLVELVSGGILLIATLVATNLFGLAGAGAAYALAQLAHLLVLWFVIGDLAETRPGRLQLGLILLASGTVVVVLVDPPQVVLAALFSAAALVLALIAWPRLIDLQRRRLLS